MPRSVTPARLAMVDALVSGDLSPATWPPRSACRRTSSPITSRCCRTRVSSSGRGRRATGAGPISASCRRCSAPRGRRGSRAPAGSCSSAPGTRPIRNWPPRCGEPGRAPPAGSAGTHPADRVHPRAVEVARRHGLRLDPLATAHVMDVTTGADLVIAVCDTAHEDLAGTAVRRPGRPGHRRGAPDSRRDPSSCRATRR